MIETVETVVRVISYTLLISAILAAASILPAIFYSKRKRKKAAALLLLLCLSVELTGLAYLAYHPFFVCPKEYRQFVSEEERRSLISFNSGIYSQSIPFVPVCVAVAHADEVEITVRTYYVPIGCTEMEYCADGPALTRNIFGQP